MQSSGKTPYSPGSSSTPSTSSNPSTMDQAKQKAGEAAEQVKSVAGDVASTVQDKAGQAVDQAQQAVTPKLEEQKQNLSGSLSGTARALRETSSQLGEEVPMAAKVLDQGVNQIEKLSSFLETHTIGEIIEETEQFARRQPTIFLAGALALGFIGARFLKSSRRHLTDTSYASYGDRSSMYSGASYGSGGSMVPATRPMTPQAGQYGSAPSYGSSPAPQSTSGSTPSPSSYGSTSSQSSQGSSSTPYRSTPSSSTSPSTSRPAEHNTSPMPPISGGSSPRNVSPGSEA